MAPNSILQWNNFVFSSVAFMSDAFFNLTGVFIFFGLSGIAPATHYGIVNGWEKSLEEVAIGWLILMGSLYITGALFYAMRIPERFFPGKLDIWVNI